MTSTSSPRTRQFSCGSTVGENANAVRHMSSQDVLEQRGKTFEALEIECFFLLKIYIYICGDIIKYNIYIYIILLITDTSSNLSFVQCMAPIAQNMPASGPGPRCRLPSV